MVPLKGIPLGCAPLSLRIRGSRGSFARDAFPMGQKNSFPRKFRVGSHEMKRDDRTPERYNDTIVLSC